MNTPDPGERKNTFISDQPSPSDYLDFKPYVSGLVDIITARETQTPLTLGISGSWGSGKTTLMHLMEKEVSARARQGKGRTLKCLWVNVWQVSQHGEGGQALLQALFTKVRGRLGLPGRVSFGWFLLRDRINYSALARQLAVNSYRVLIVLAPLVAVRYVNPAGADADGVDEGRLSAAVSVLLGFWLILKPLVEAAREKVSLDLGSVLSDAPYESKVSALQTLQTHFERLVRQWVGDDGRLVVFIDDLDRCSPDSIANTLEALKLFATTERCVYVLGIDQDVVARSIQTKYKEITGATGGDELPLEGVRYLEKIVQLPFLLPQIEVTDIRSYIESFKAAWPHDGCADIFVEGLPPNPRQLKRAVNVFFLLWQLAESRREKLGATVTPLRLAKVVALQTAHPDLFEWFRRAPFLLKELEVYYRRGPEEQRLLEQNLAEGKRLTAAAARPGLKRLFELHGDDPLAAFGDLGPTDLKAFFSLTRSVTLGGAVADGGGAAVKSETPEAVVKSVAGDAPGGEAAAAVETSVYGPQSPPVSSLHQLPPPPRDFTGRAAELEETASKIEQGGVSICAVQGLGGVGKTAFALMLAERLTPRYPDAQLYLDLKGTAETPLSVVEALTHVIGAFYSAARLPEGEEGLRSLYRSVLHGRRVLLLLDNAAGREQVAPLVPPEGCALIITTRRRFTLPGLTALTLDALPPSEARELLHKISPNIGEHAEEIARLCGYLPLALRLAASLLAERPDLSPAEYVNRLSDGRKRLELVEASLSLSYEQLSPDLQRLLRLLSVFPETFDANGAAAVWGEGAEDVAKDSLGELLKFSLVEWTESTGRYSVNNLVRLFISARLSEQEREAGRRRHSEHYLHVIAEAGRLYLEGGESVRAGLGLFDAERRNIEEGQAWAAGKAADDEFAAQLCSFYAETGADLLALRLHPRERIRWMESALDAARRLRPAAAQGKHANDLGMAYSDLGETKRAFEFFEQALTLARESGHALGEQRALGNLGNAYALQGDTPRVVALLSEQLDIARNIGDRRGEAQALTNLGNAHAAAGESLRAVSYYEKALDIVREIGDRVGEAYVLGNLGVAYSALDDNARARECFEMQLAIAREIGDRRAEGAALGALGLICLNHEDKAERAIEFFEQALNLALATGDRLSEAGMLFNLALAHDDLGSLRDAVSYARKSLEIFEQTESPQAAVVKKQLYEWTAIGA